MGKTTLGVLAQCQIMMAPVVGVCLLNMLLTKTYLMIRLATDWARVAYTEESRGFLKTDAI